MKHTKGPWILTYRHGMPHIYTVDSKTFIVGSHLNIKTEAVKHNFQLISAAPELLEALQIATRLIATAENNGAYKDCALPLIGKKSLEKMEALLERLK